MIGEPGSILIPSAVIYKKAATNRRAQASEKLIPFLEEASVLRRDVLSVLFTWPLAFSPRPSRATPIPGPHFYSITRGQGRVFLLGFGESSGNSWFSPGIQTAFDDSSSLWLETGNQGPASTEVKEKIESLGRQTGSRTFFDELEPSVRKRAAAYMAQLGIEPESLQNQRPWHAYYAIMAAFYRNRRPSGMPVLPDELLSKRATDTRKPIFYELPTQLSFAELMARMPAPAQSQYIEWLLDYLDDVKAGRVVELDDKWTRGDFSAETRTLDRMRTRMPALYRAQQIQRNAWWAKKIDALMTAGNSHFVAVGNLHSMGMDGIPAQLAHQHPGVTITPESQVRQMAHPIQ
jgi:uncharacterized protein